MKLYLMYLRVILNRMSQYRGSLLLAMIGQVLVTVSGLFGIFFLMARFQTIRNYTMNDIFLCYSITVLSYSLAECFFRGFDQFNTLLQSGEFDRFLLRPRSLIIQILGSKFELTRIGRMIQSVILIIYVLLTNSSVLWTTQKFILLFLMIFSGTIFFACLFVIQASLTFYTLERIELFNILTDGIREFGRYPVDVYGKMVLRVTTFIIPFALVQYYPFLYLVGKSTNAIYMIVPLVSFLFILPTSFFWSTGIKKYASTGS